MLELEAASIDMCEDYKREGAPIAYCETNNDYWANAAYQCFKKGGHLPSKQELKEIASATSIRNAIKNNIDIAQLQR